MAKEPITIEIKLTATDIEYLIVDFLVKEGFLKNRDHAFRWEYDYENDGEVVGAYITKYIAKEE